MDSGTEFELRRITEKVGKYQGFFELSGPANFVTEHEDWVDADFILSNDLVTFQGLSATQAWFCVCPQSPYLPSFTFANQYQFATHLVIMDHNTMHRLAKRVGHPKVPVTIINNMGRCGSTMICQMLEQVPGLRVMSEPWCLIYALHLFNTGELTTEEYHRIIQSCIKLQCKLEHPEASQIAIKLPLLCLSQTGLIKSLLPSLRHVFVFRDTLSSMKSLIKVTAALSVDQDDFNEFFGNKLPLPSSILQDNFRTQILAGEMTEARVDCLVIMATLRAAREYVKEHGDFLDIFTYEELLKDGPRVDRLLALFQLEGQPKMIVDSSWRQVDSQGSTPISRETLAKQRVVCQCDVEDLVSSLDLPPLTTSLEGMKDYIRKGKLSTA